MTKPTPPTAAETFEADPTPANAVARVVSALTKTPGTVDMQWIIQLQAAEAVLRGAEPNPLSDELIRRWWVARGGTVTLAGEFIMHESKVFQLVRGRRWPS